MFTTEHFPDCFCCLSFAFLPLWIHEPIPLPYQLEDIGACSLSAFYDNLLLLFMLSRHHFPHPQNLSCVIFTQKFVEGKKVQVSSLTISEALQSLPKEISGHIFTGRKQWQPTEQQQGDRQAFTGFGSTRKLSSSAFRSFTSFLNLKNIPEPFSSTAGDAEGSSACPSLPGSRDHFMYE